jgi:hypothetical protein
MNTHTHTHKTVAYIGTAIRNLCFYWIRWIKLSTIIYVIDSGIFNCRIIGLSFCFHASYLKSRRIKWKGHVACIGEMGNTYKLVAGKGRYDLEEILYFIHFFSYLINDARRNSDHASSNGGAISCGRNATCFCSFLAQLTNQRWRWRRYFPPKRLDLSQLHGVTSQKIELFIVTTVRTSFPTIFGILPPLPNLGVKLPGREANHLPLTSAEVKKTWIYEYTFTSLYPFVA